ncbi:AAA family ATPase [Pseudomonas fluorescens]|uniref:ATP-dependent DNA helicase n=1 Tax=Pseudomonas viridiflava TaxID=33069 RepID=UPI000F017DE1|nr:AAA family ATPase [Pseudomonas viridiflava]MBD8089304.1 AAA family ATPase [Pseudomonas fluorescens]MBD8615269.1 AAA family ATPase [Pseudomonas putida]
MQTPPNHSRLLPLDLANMRRYGMDHYEHVFTAGAKVNDKQTMMFPTPIHGEFPVPIRDNLVRGVVMGHINCDVEMVPHQTYICLFRVTDKFGPSHRWLMLDSIIPAKDYGVSKIVHRVMDSWRFSFLKDKKAKWYEAFGENSFMVLDHNPEAVREKLDLTDRQFLRVKNEWGNLRDMWHEIRMLLRHNIEMKYVDLLIDVFRENRDSTMDRHPFRATKTLTLPSDVQAKYFRATGVLDQVREDTENVVSDYLDAVVSRDGATAVTLQQAILSCSTSLKIKAPIIETTLLEMIRQGRADYRHMNGEDSVSLGKMLRNDESLASELMARSGVHTDTVPFQRFDGGSKANGDKIVLNDDQNTAVYSALMHRVSIITGGPGVGKTTASQAVIKALRHLYPGGRILLAAPTGKAARRLTEVTQVSCSTLHRLLGMAPNTSSMMTSFGEHDTLIIDELSMVDASLLTNVVRHMKNRGRLVLMGDKDQLESVDSGAVMRDIIASRRFPVVELLDVQRQAAQSLIVSGAYSILRGEMPVFGVGEGDLRLIEASTPAEIAQKVNDLIQKVIPHEHGIGLENIQVLSSMRKGDAGVNALNKNLKKVFNPKAGEAKAWGRQLGNNFYHVGDRVMQLRNRYDKDIQNGETGTILDFNESRQEFILALEDREVSLPYNSYLDITHGWASTVHKSQGSEFECVIFVLPDDHLNMLTKRTIFTAMTRGKKQVYFVGSKETLAKALSGLREDLRRSHLAFFFADKHMDVVNSPQFKALVSRKPKQRPTASQRISLDDIDVPF